MVLSLPSLWPQLVLLSSLFIALYPRHYPYSILKQVQFQPADFYMTACSGITWMPALLFSPQRPFLSISLYEVSPLSQCLKSDHPTLFSLFFNFQCLSWSEIILGICLLWLYAYLLEWADNVPVLFPFFLQGIDYSRDSVTIPWIEE